MSVEVIKRYGLKYDDFNLEDEVTFKNVFLMGDGMDRIYLSGKTGVVVDRTPSFVKVKAKEGCFIEDKDAMWFLTDHLEGI